MTENEKESSNKIRVLISGCLPPPMGGMATYFQMIINSTLSQYIDFNFVETSSHNRDFSSAGRASISNIYEAIKDWVRYLKALIVYKPQITHIGTAFGLSFLKHSFCVIVARLFGKTVLLHPHCSLSMLYHERSSLWKAFFRSIIKWTDGVIVLSNEWLELKTIVPGVKIRLLPNAVRLEDFSKAREEHFEKRQKDHFSILYLGYVGKAKGTFDLIEAAKLIKFFNSRIHFELVGGELTPGEFGLIRENIESTGIGDTTRLNGPAYNEEKLAFFEDADLFIYPSYYEGVPIAVLEAMASALPIIATKVGGLPDIVKNGVNGILVDAGHPEQLAEAIMKLFTDPSLRQSMSKNSYNYVCENYSLDQHINKLVSIYSSVRKL